MSYETRRENPGGEHGDVEGVRAFRSGALTVNLCQALAGKAEFAVWHLPTLTVAWAMGDCGAIATRAASIVRLMRLRWRGYMTRG